MTQHRAAALFLEQDTVMDIVRKDQASVASEINIDDLNVGFPAGKVILPRQCAADLAIADIVMDRLDPESWLGAVVRDLEQSEAADERRAQILQHEALVAIVPPGMTQHAIAVSPASNVGKPLPILIRRVLADAMDIAHHREAKRVGVEPAEARVVEIRLKDDARMRMQELQHRAFRDQTFVMQPPHDLVMDKSRTSFVHQLQLFLRVKVLGDQPDDTNQLALPVLEPRSPLLDQIQQILLG